MRIMRHLSGRSGTQQTKKKKKLMQAAAACIISIIITPTSPPVHWKQGRTQDFKLKGARDKRKKNFKYVSIYY